MIPQKLMTRSLLFLDIFKENIDLIKDKGWIVSEPESPRWWGGLQSGEEIIISSILVQMTRWGDRSKGNFGNEGKWLNKLR